MSLHSNSRSPGAMPWSGATLPTTPIIDEVAFELVEKIIA